MQHSSKFPDSQEKTASVEFHFKDAERIKVINQSSFSISPAHLDRGQVESLHQQLGEWLGLPQGQGEPAAWMDPRSPKMHATISNEVKQHNVKFGGAPASAVNGYTIPLYTHAAPAEVEGLRHDIASYLETMAKTCELLGVDLEAAKTAEGKPSDVLFEQAQALRAENERLKKGFYQEVTDADIKKIHDYVSDPGLPTGAFLRHDAYDLANFTAHMCREVQASRIKLVEAQARISSLEHRAADVVEGLDGKELPGAMVHRVRKLKARLSACAEPSAPCVTPVGHTCPGDGVNKCKKCPSAPVEIDERTEFEVYARSKGIDVSVVVMHLTYPLKFSHYANPVAQDAFGIWQARAALERVCTPSAPEV